MVSDAQDTDRVAVGFAEAADFGWLVDNDEHLEDGVIRQKIEFQEYVVSKVAHAPVGFMRLSLFWSFIPFIDLIRVQEQYQGRGVARAMLNYLEEAAGERGRTLIMSSCSTDESDSRLWHIKSGFTESGQLDDLHPIQDGAEIFFVKRISQAA